MEKVCHGVANPQIEDGLRTEQNTVYVITIHQCILQIDRETMSVSQRDRQIGLCINE